MDRDYARRKEELLAECEVSPELFAGLLERLRPLARPFIACLARRRTSGARPHLSGGLALRPGAQEL
jgi:hypothetical protein